MISSFAGPHRFLSNFYPAHVDFGVFTFPTVEHAYQAAKTRVPAEQARIKRARSAGAAKHLGKKVTLRPDWDSIKIEVMWRLVWQKFYNSPELTRMLVATGAEELVEGNYWGDTFWGQCPVGTGFNHLGKILMEVRGELRNGNP